MVRLNKITAVTALILLIMATLFGCSLLFRDTSEQNAWYIKLNISDSTGSKAINVKEHDVTGLNIEVFDPEEQPLDTIAWTTEDGSKSYLIPVTQEGQHNIVVTHISEENGQIVEAAEWAYFNIQAMVITVIDIVPGFIGTINVEPGGEEPSDPFEWLCGYWVEDPAAAPYTSYLEINGEGFWQWWERYDGSGGVYESGIWYVQDGTLMLVVEGMHLPTEVIKLSNDEVILDMVEFQAHLYRKGTEPGGFIFDQSPMVLPLSAGEWTEGSIADFEMQLYSFQAPTAGLYDIYWKEQGDPDPPSFTANITVSVYQEDQSTFFFESEEISAYFTPMTVNLGTGETIYIVVDAWFEGGTYGIRIQQQ